jgi:hypothetical protein
MGANGSTRISVEAAGLGQAWQGVAWRGGAWPGKAWEPMAQLESLWKRHGVAWSGKARLGGAGQGMGANGSSVGYGLGESA